MQRTDKEILTMLEAKFVHKYKCEQILSWCHKMARLKFLDCLFQPLIDCGKNGVVLQVGSKPARDGAERLKYVPLFGPNMNDNEGADKYCSVQRSNCGKCNCRLCFCPSKDFWNMNELRKPYSQSAFNNWRSGPLSEALGRRHQEIWMKWMREGPRSLTAEEDAVYKTAKSFNITNVDTPIFGWYRFHQKKQLATPHQLNPIDVLHTFLKGKITVL